MLMMVLIQGKLTEAESTFSSMKESGCFPDVLTYTAMIQAYNDDGKILFGKKTFQKLELILHFLWIIRELEECVGPIQRDGRKCYTARCHYMLIPHGSIE